MELVPEAVRDAMKNAEKNGIENCSFFAGRAENIMQNVLRDIDRYVCRCLPSNHCGHRLLKFWPMVVMGCVLRTVGSFLYIHMISIFRLTLFRGKYCMSKESCPFSYSDSLYKNGHNFLDV